MENSRSKMESMKPVLFKAGIPLALSVAGFIIARIATRKPRLSTAASQQSQIDEEFDSCEVEEEMFGLKRRIEAMQWELEKQFLDYQDLKDQEMQLMEHLNKMVLETNRVEFLGREISLMEAANKRFEDLAVDYLNLFRFLEVSKSENGKLHARIKKLLRKNKKLSGILRKQSKQIQCKEAEISGAKMELELKGECIRLMEDEINEKNALLDELRTAEESAGLKVGEETASMEEQEDEELIQLKWRNACLTHELTRGDKNTRIEEFGSDDELNGGNVGEGDMYFGSKTQNRADSRRRKLITRFKRWMEGGEKSKEEKHRSKCFPRHFVSDEDYLHARKSCSSV
ncbi:hypothetical protein ACS0TY_015156 [Phlomoides rotata]